MVHSVISDGLGQEEGAAGVFWVLNISMSMCVCM